MATLFNDYRHKVNFAAKNEKWKKKITKITRTCIHAQSSASNYRIHLSRLIFSRFSYSLLFERDSSLNIATNTHTHARVRTRCTRDEFVSATSWIPNARALSFELRQCQRLQEPNCLCVWVILYEHICISCHCVVMLTATTTTTSTSADAEDVFQSLFFAVRWLYASASPFS